LLTRQRQQGSNQNELKGEFEMANPAIKYEEKESKFSNFALDLSFLSSSRSKNDERLLEIYDQILHLENQYKKLELASDQSEDKNEFENDFDKVTTEMSDLQNEAKQITPDSIIGVLAFISLSLDNSEIIESFNDETTMEQLQGRNVLFARQILSGVKCSTDESEKAAVELKMSNEEDREYSPDVKAVLQGVQDSIQQRNRLVELAQEKLQIEAHCKNNLNQMSEEQAKENSDRIISIGEEAAALNTYDNIGTLCKIVLGGDATYFNEAQFSDTVYDKVQAQGYLAAKRFIEIIDLEAGHI